MKQLNLILITLYLFCNSFDTFAYSSGITQKTRKHTPQGCAYCHTFDQYTTTGFFSGPDTIIVGSTTQFTITLTTTLPYGKFGVDIAAKVGTLGLVPNNDTLKIMNGELVHNNGGIYQHQITIPFTFTASSSPGIDSLYATANVGYTGKWNWIPEKRIIVIQGIGINNNSIPVFFTLVQNYPNPFNSQTKISYNLPKKDFVTLKIFDLQGRLVKTLINGIQSEGNHTLSFDGTTLTSGIYFYSLSAGEFAETKKMLLIK
jgi:hypothetical protein